MKVKAGESYLEGLFHKRDVDIALASSRLEQEMEEKCVNAEMKICVDWDIKSFEPEVRKVLLAQPLNPFRALVIKPVSIREKDERRA